MKVYQVKDWDKNFENNKSRERDQCSFVCIPNKQDGLGLIRILMEKDGPSIYGIWHLIVGALSRQHKPRDGWMTDDGHQTGTAWAPDCLALRWRRKPEEIQRALEVLSSEGVGWLKVIETVPAECPPTARDVPAECPTSALKERRKEGKKDLIFSAVLDSQQFKDLFDKWMDYRRKNGGKVKDFDALFQNQLDELTQWGIESATEAIKASMLNGWTGVFKPKNKPQTKQSNGYLVNGCVPNAISAEEWNAKMAAAKPCTPERAAAILRGER